VSTLFVERLADVSPGAFLALIDTAIAFSHRIVGGAAGDDKSPRNEMVRSTHPTDSENSIRVVVAA
jgi:hypothetical protein